MPAADAGRRGRACQLPVHGPVRRAARARSTSHHFLTLLHFDASRICMRAERQASSCASAPQPAKLNPTPAVILSLGPRLARRFARSLHLHPYNCALLHRCMPPCLARVLLPSPPRFPFALQTPDRLALPKHSRSRAPACLHLTSIDTIRLRTTNRHNGLLYLLRPVLHKGRTSRTTHPNSFVSGLLVPSIDPSMLTIDQQTQMSSLSSASHVTCPSPEGPLSLSPNMLACSRY